MFFCFSYDIDHLNGHDNATKHHHQHQHHEHFNRASTTQHVEMAMATAAGARDATRLELVCLFYFIFIFILLLQCFFRLLYIWLGINEGVETHQTPQVCFVLHFIYIFNYTNEYLRYYT